METVHDVIFPVECERCHSYETEQNITDEVASLLKNSDLLSLLEKSEISILECSYENKLLYRCSKTEQERTNELNGLKNSKVYFTHKYYHEREEGYVSKTYGPGAYFLEEISPYVREHNPFVHCLLYTGTQTLHVAELTTSEYSNITVMQLWCQSNIYGIHISPYILFAAWLKNIKNVHVLKITGSDYEYPILIFL